MTKDHQHKDHGHMKQQDKKRKSHGDVHVLVPAPDTPGKPAPRTPSPHPHKKKVAPDTGKRSRKTVPKEGEEAAEPQKRLGRLARMEKYLEGPGGFLLATLVM